MPISREWVKFYRSAEWKVIRARILKRAGGKFDFAGKYLGGARCEKCGRLDPFRRIGVRLRGYALQVAHLDHNPEHNDDSNLKALCGACHLNYDQEKHRATRCARKDAERPLIATLAETGGLS